MDDPTGYTRPRFNNLCHVTPNVKLNFLVQYIFNEMSKACCTQTLTITMKVNKIKTHVQLALPSCQPLLACNFKLLCLYMAKVN